MVSPKTLTKSQQEYLKHEFEDLFERLGYSVVYGRGEFKNGACLVHEDSKIVVSLYTPDDMLLEFFTKILSRIDLSDVYVLPAIREMIEK